MKTKQNVTKVVARKRRTHPRKVVIINPKPRLCLLYNMWYEPNEDKKNETRNWWLQLTRLSFTSIHLRAWITFEHHKIPYNYIESLTVRKNQNEGNHGYDKTPRTEIESRGSYSNIEFATWSNEGKGVHAEKIEITKDPKVKLNKDDGSYVVVDSIPCMEFLNELSLKLSNS